MLKFPPFPVMLVDDEPSALRITEALLHAGGITHTQVATGVDPLRLALGSGEVEALLLDLGLPHMAGETLLTSLRETYPDVPVIVLTGTDDLDTAVCCMRDGAFDYMVKPVASDRLLASVKRAIELRGLRRENDLLKERVLHGALEHPEAFRHFDAVSREMLSVLRYAEAISRSPEPVLITGETGVGKELMAKSLHELGGNGAKFVAVNVAGLDENAFTDTLFGHRKGAFTGATETRPGLLEQASGGTLFLDEIGDLAPPLQVKLLRLLQERDYFPLGSDVLKQSNARVIVATNVNIRVLRESSTFRRDLFYRLCHHHIEVPPLRERTDDLPLLVRRFVEEAAQRLSKPSPELPTGLIPLLATYSFPGNVRELRGLLYDVLSRHTTGPVPLALFKTCIDAHAASMPEPGPGAGTGAAAVRTVAGDPPVGDPEPRLSFPTQLPSLKHAQTLLVAEAMRRTGGKQTLAARLLGISRQALNKRLRSPGAG